MVTFLVLIHLKAWITAPVEAPYARNLTAPAYLASLQASEQLSAVILSPMAGMTQNGLRDSCLVSWRNVVGSSITLPASTVGQRG